MTLLMISIVPLYFYLIPLLLFCLFRSKPAKEVILSGYVRMVFSDSRAYSNTSTRASRLHKRAHGSGQMALTSIERHKREILGNICEGEKRDICNGGQNIS